MIKPDFETTYTALLKQLTQIDYLAKNTLLGATIQDNDPVIPFYGIPQRVSRSGVTDMAGRESSEALDSRIILALSGLGATRKKMFGGTCHLMLGNMMCGVYKDCLVLRLGEAQAGKALKKPHVRPFDVTGKPMKGWVMVEKEGFDGRQLDRWLEKASVFVESLPPKPA